jgi:hypothetical protein
MDDGFVAVAPLRRGGAKRSPNTVSFLTNRAVRVTTPDAWCDGMRAVWQWNGNGTARLRIGEHGDFATTRVGTGGQIQVSANSLFAAIGRRLHGTFPCRVDGLDVYIDIAEEVSA